MAAAFLLLHSSKNTTKRPIPLYPLMPSVSPISCTSPAKSFNTPSPTVYPNRYTATWATTEETDTYEIRELLRLSQKKWKQMEKAKEQSSCN